MTDSPAYGSWGLVLVNSIVFVLFAYSFFKPTDDPRLAIIQRVQRVSEETRCCAINTITRSETAVA